MTALAALDKRARRAAAQYQAASTALDEARQRALLVGREVSWEHGAHIRWGLVMEYFMGRVKLLRETTGRKYWVDCWRIREVSPND